VVYIIFKPGMMSFQSQQMLSFLCNNFFWILFNFIIFCYHFTLFYFYKFLVPLSPRGKIPAASLKGPVSRDFLLLVFFMNQFPPSPRVFHLDRFEFFRKFAEIFASQGAPPVSTTPVANLSTVFASVVDTGGKFATGVNDNGGKFATGVNDAGGKLPPVSTTSVANLPPVSMTPVANNGNNIRLQTP
jgi:hypothetical protein